MCHSDLLTIVQTFTQCYKVSLIVSIAMCRSKGARVAFVVGSHTVGLTRQRTPFPMRFMACFAHVHILATMLC